MTIMSSEVSERALLPCPFCGGEPVAGSNTAENHFVRCRACQVRQWGWGTAERAADAWNTRAALSAPPIDDEATQADRDAAADIYTRFRYGNDRLRRNIIAGRMDEDPITQLLARHRIAAAGEVRRRTIEALGADGLNVTAFSADPADSRVLRVHFRQAVGEADRARLLGAINAHNRSLSAKEESR